MLGGILEAWDILEGKRPETFWFERILPISYRLSFAALAGLEGYAVGCAKDLPPALRSKAWIRLLDWVRRYKILSPRRQVALLQLLSKLCLYWDVQDLLDRNPGGGSASEGEARGWLAYIRAWNPFLLWGPALKDRTEGLLEAAQAAPPSTRARYVAALRCLVLELERKRMGPRFRRAEITTRETLAGLAGRIPPYELAIQRSKLRRALSYVPFLASDAEGTRRELALSQELAEEAFAQLPSGRAARSGPAWSFARENLHAVLATRAVTEMHLKKPARALPWFARMRAMDPWGAWHRIGAGRACLGLGRLDEAKEEYLAAYELGAFGREEAADGLALCAERAAKREESKAWRRSAAEIRAKTQAAQAAVEKGRPAGPPDIKATSASRRPSNPTRPGPRPRR